VITPKGDYVLCGNATDDLCSYGTIMLGKVRHMMKLSIQAFTRFVSSRWESFAKSIALNYVFENHKNNVQIKGKGTVVRILHEGNEDVSHQRLIVKTFFGQTILVTRTLEVSHKITSIMAGDMIVFHGIYKWTPKGGVVEIS
jgi:hypothetical protein